jgi:outer membrane protein TolC
MLEAQRTLFDTKHQTVDALARYHQARADLEEMMVRSGPEDRNADRPATDSREENPDASSHR